MLSTLLFKSLVNSRASDESLDSGKCHNIYVSLD
nr:MAG TPA: hypothetical protein [Caudoviricetes sp.]